MYDVRIAIRLQRSLLNALLSCPLTLGIPPGKHQDGRVAFEDTRKRFGTFYPQVDSIILKGGNRGLWNARNFGQVVLAHALEFTSNPSFMRPRFPLPE